MSQRLASEIVTEGIRIRAAAMFLREESNPETGNYLFAYRVTIMNEGKSNVRLLARHWVIINGNGDREDVEGPGVVGKTPLLGPGEVFEYTSFCPLNTEWGTMEGTYRMQRDDGTLFDAVIGRFYLTADSPRVHEAP